MVLMYGDNDKENIHHLNLSRNFSTGEHYAIGLTLDQISNEFVWPASKNPAHDLTWAPNNPLKGNETGTAFSWSNSKKNFMLFDAEASREKRAVCQVPDCPPSRD